MEILNPIDDEGGREVYADDNPMNNSQVDGSNEEVIEGHQSKPDSYVSNPIEDHEEDSIEQYISEQRRSEGSQLIRTNSILEVTDILSKQSNGEGQIKIDPQSTYEQINDFMNSDSERDHIIFKSKAPLVLTQSVLLLNSDRDFSDKQYNIQNPEANYFNSQNIFPLDPDPNSLDSPQSIGFERRNTVPQKPSKKLESAKQRISLGEQGSQQKQPRLSTPHLKEESNFNINTLSIHQSQYQKTLSYQQSSQGKDTLSQHSEELARIVRIYIEELSFTTNEAGSLHRSFSFDNNLIEQNQKYDQPQKNASEKIRQHIIKGMFELLIVGKNNFNQCRDQGESPQVLFNSIIEQFEGPFNQQKPVMVSSFTSSKKDKECKLNIITSFTPVDQIQTSDDILRIEIDKLKNDIEVLKGQNEIAELRMMEYYINEQTYKKRWMEGEEIVLKLTTLNQQLNRQIQSLETKQDQQQTDLVSQIKEREEQLYKLQAQYLLISNQNQQIQIQNNLQQQSIETQAIQTYNNFVVQRNKNNQIQNNEVSRSTPSRQPRLLGLSNQSDKQRQMNRDQCFSQSSLTGKLTPPRPPSHHNQRSYTRIEQSPSNHIEFKQFPPPSPNNRIIPSKNESINTAPDTQYRGDLVNGIRSGRGTYHYEDGKVYQGSWQNNMRDGYGILRFSEKDIYSGNWLNDLMHGCGFLLNRNFIESQESIHHSNLNGSSQWISYKGQFKQNKFDGFGVLIFSQGQKFQGEFKNGFPNGRGTFYNSKGDVQHGLWVDGKISKNF